MAALNTSRGCTSNVSIVPSLTGSTRISRRRVFSSSTCRVSTFFTRFCSRSSCAMASGWSSTGDSRCKSIAIFRASANAATSVTALSRPMPLTLRKSSTDARASA